MTGALPPLPLSVLTGFLGAGKTTLLNRLLPDPALADTLVIVNEFGEIGLDHLLIERLDADMILLSAGCLCCTLRGDLIAMLEDLLRRRDNKRIKPFERVVLETTGIADPVPIVQALIANPYLALRYRLDRIVTVVDAVNGMATLDAHEEAIRQVAFADRLLLTKTDLVSDEISSDPLKARLRILAPEAVLLGEPRASDLFSGSAEARARFSAPSGPLPLAHHRHDSVRSYCVTGDYPIRRGAFEAFLDVLVAAHGPKLLRVKGLVAMADDIERPVLIQGAQHVFHPPEILPRWPDSDRRTRLVFIVKDLERVFIDRLWHAFSGRAGPDIADIAALTDNPLNPLGLSAS